MRRREVLLGFLGVGLMPLAARARRSIPASELSGLREGGPTRRFYMARDDRPAWDERAALVLADRFGEARRHAIDTAPLIELMAAAGGGSTRDVALTRAALAFAQSLAHGVVDPSAVYATYGLTRNRVDVVSGLGDALHRGELGVWLDGLAPQDDEYRRLGAAYLEEVASISSARPLIAHGPAIRRGASDPRVRALAEVVGSPLSPTAPPVFTDELVEAVELRQRDFGVKDDGVVGNDTLRALNLGPAERARRLALNLERRRWLYRTPPRTRVDVNLAAAAMTYFRDGAPVWSTRVVVGRPGDETPNLEETFDRLIVNPPWYVPRSIARDELIPKGRAHLRRHHFRRVRGRLIQDPGPWSALGLVKFDMRNRHAIYLHDTPAKHLFDRSVRHLSHGCVRVEDAIGFARLLANERGLGEEFAAALAASTTRLLPLGETITVRLLYHSVFEGDAGELRYRIDAYGRDEKLARALGMDSEPRQTVRPGLPVPLGP